MKILIMLLLTVSCQNPLNPDFKVGDCVASEDSEKWEKDNYAFHVVEIGESHYRLLWLKPDIMKGDEATKSFNTVDRFYRKIVCPK